MKGSVSPAVAVVAVVLLVALIGFVGYRTFAGPGQQESTSLGNVKVDLSKIKPGDFDSVKKDIEAASTSRQGTAR